jgi:hypothetical protein
VSSLAFLTPEAATDTAIARSPMERLARAAGARFEPRDGWSVAVSCGEPAVERRRLEQAVAFADRSSVAKLEVQAKPPILATVISAARGGLELEPGLASRAVEAWWCPVTPSRELILGEPATAHELRGAVAVAVAEVPDDASVTVVDVTCGLAGLALLGPLARELLAPFSAIDVRASVTPVSGFRPGSVARNPGYVLCESEQRLLVMVGWALGEYLWRRRGELRDSYDVVIVGGGAHGLATAYYLGQVGVSNVAVLEQGYIGSGAAGRNTTILRSNYKTPEGARFYDAGLRTYERLSAELDFNLLFSQCGHLTLPTATGRCS